MNKMPLFILVWLLYGVLSLPLTLAGVLIVGILAAWPYAMVMRSSTNYKDGRIIRAWRWAWVEAIWGNDEDGVDGLPLVNMTSDIVQPRQTSWSGATMKWSRWRRIFVWSALRNSTANLRFRPFFGMLIDPLVVRFVLRVRNDGTHVWWLGHQGCRASFRWYYGKGRCFWIGWKILPKDLRVNAHMLPASDTRAPGVGFAFQPFAGVENELAP